VNCQEPKNGYGNGLSDIKTIQKVAVRQVYWKTGEKTLSQFVKVMPIEYRAVLGKMKNKSSIK
jgi:hypothetical protein